MTESHDIDTGEFGWIRQLDPIAFHQFKYQPYFQSDLIYQDDVETTPVGIGDGVGAIVDPYGTLGLPLEQSGGEDQKPTYIGDAVQANGEDDDLRMPGSEGSFNHIHEQGPMTLEVKARFHSVQPNSANLLTIIRNYGTSVGFQLEYHQDNNRVDFNTGDIDIRESSGIATDTWHTIRVTRDSEDVVKLWVDGVRVASQTQTSFGTGDADNPLRFFESPRFGNKQLHGSLEYWFTCDYEVTP